MKNFTYYRPATAQAAVALLDRAWGTAELLAGGTDLLDLQKEYVAQPDKVVSIGDIAELKSISTADSVIKIGAGVKLAAIAADKGVREHFPALAAAAGDVGGPQIRNMGTLGGNLCQRNRCWYFRDEHVPCLLKGGDKCFALDGENRYHAVFSQGHKCVIVHPSTLAPVLIALGADALVQGPDKQRTIKLAEFFKAPTNANEREHVLASNEIVLSVSITTMKLKNSSYEVRQKQAYDWPAVQAAVAFLSNGGKVSEARIVLGHVAPTPHVAVMAGIGLEGKEITEATATEAGKVAAEGVRPLSQTAYKVRLIHVAVKRALLAAAGMKKYWEV